MIEHVHDVTNASRTLLDLAAQEDGRHGVVLHIGLDERFGVKVAVKENLSAGHGSLKERSGRSCFGFCGQCDGHWSV